MPKVPTTIQTAKIAAASAVLVAVITTIGVVVSSTMKHSSNDSERTDAPHIETSPGAVIVDHVANSSVNVNVTPPSEPKLDLAAVSTERSDENATKIDVKVINKGNAPSFITAATLSTIGIWVIKLPIRTAPSLQEVTATYTMPTKGGMLPLTPKNIVVPLSQSVPPLSTDRFQIIAQANGGYTRSDDATIRVYQCKMTLASDGGKSLATDVFLFCDRPFDFGTTFLKPTSFAPPRFRDSHNGSPPSKQEIEGLKLYYKGLFEENKKAYSEIASAPGSKSTELESMIELWKDLPFE